MYYSNKINTLLRLFVHAGILRRVYEIISIQRSLKYNVSIKCTRIYSIYFVRHTVCLTRAYTAKLENYLE